MNDDKPTRFHVKIWPGRRDVQSSDDVFSPTIDGLLGELEMFHTSNMN